MIFFKYIAVIGCLLFPVSSFQDPEVKLPLRSPGALPGSALVAQLSDLPLELRERQIKLEVLAGNFPDFLRQLAPIEIEFLGINGRRATATYWVMPDYLMVGSDDDFVRMPMTPMSAQAIADSLGFFLSTSKIADDVYRAASVKLEPQPLTAERESFATFVAHHHLIEVQRRGRSGLIAGIKKDVISTSRLFETDRPDRVALYGWHKLDGTPIQPVYTGHVNTYVDYSHGIRLVWEYILVDGKYMHFREVLSNPELRAILTYESDGRYYDGRER